MKPLSERKDRIIDLMKNYYIGGSIPPSDMVMITRVLGFVYAQDKEAVKRLKGRSTVVSREPIEENLIRGWKVIKEEDYKEVNN